MLASNFLAVWGGRPQNGFEASFLQSAFTSEEEETQLLSDLNWLTNKKAPVVNFTEFVIVLKAVKANWFTYVQSLQPARKGVFTQDCWQEVCVRSRRPMGGCHWLAIEIYGYRYIAADWTASSYPSCFYDSLRSPQSRCYRQLLQCKGFILLGYCWCLAKGMFYWL